MPVLPQRASDQRLALDTHTKLAGQIGMWLDYRLLSPTEDALLSSVGRAIALAQNFEANCKFVVMTVELGKVLQEGTVTSLEDARPFVEQLLKRMLGCNVNRFGQLGVVSPGQVSTLAAAREARNYIAHEAVEPLTVGSRAITLAKRVDRLKCEVLALAEGDALVSRWSYVIQEKEPAPIVWAGEYASAVSGWVLEPIQRSGFDAG